MSLIPIPPISSATINSFIHSRELFLKKEMSSLIGFGELCVSQKNSPPSAKSDMYSTSEAILISKPVANTMTKFGSKFNKLFSSFRNLMELPEAKISLKNSSMSISKIWVLPPAKICSFNPSYRTFGKCSPKSISMRCMPAQENFLIQIPRVTLWITTGMQWKEGQFLLTPPSEPQMNQPIISLSIVNYDVKKLSDWFYMQWDFDSIIFLIYQINSWENCCESYIHHLREYITTPLK